VIHRKGDGQATSKSWNHGGSRRSGRARRFWRFRCEKTGQGGEVRDFANNGPRPDVVEKSTGQGGAPLGFPDSNQFAGVRELR
jgi:hypothetical protein